MLPSRKNPRVGITGQIFSIHNWEEFYDYIEKRTNSLIKEKTGTFFTEVHQKWQDAMAGRLEEPHRELEFLSQQADGTTKLASWNTKMVPDMPEKLKKSGVSHA